MSLVTPADLIKLQAIESHINTKLKEYTVDGELKIHLIKQTTMCKINEK